MEGDFSFIKNTFECDLLTYDYNVINKIPGAWEALKNHNPAHSFAFHTYGKIWDTITSSMWNGHSGCSGAVSLREMEYIAKHGWDNYKNWRTK